MEHQNGAREQYQPAHPELDRQREGLAEKDPRRVQTQGRDRCPRTGVASMTWLRLIMSRATKSITR